MSGRLRMVSVRRRAASAAVLVAAGAAMATHAAAVLAQIPALPFQAVAIQGFPGGLAGGADAERIGDPWWDDAEAQRPAAEEPPPPGPREDEAAAVPGDPMAMFQAQLRSQAEMFAQQFRQQPLAILRTELSVVRQSCPSLTKEQRGRVLEACRGAIDRATDEQLLAAGRGPRARSGGPANFSRAIRDAVDASVKANATETEWTAYQDERRLREERRQAAVVAEIVAEVDREAYLDDAECEALAKVITESNPERWWPAVVVRGQMHASNGMGGAVETMLPGLEGLVEKALGAKRKAEWLAACDEARKRVAGGAGIQQGIPGPILRGVWAQPGAAVQIETVEEVEVKEAK